MCQQPGSWYLLKNAYSRAELPISAELGASFELCLLRACTLVAEEGSDLAFRLVLEEMDANQRNRRRCLVAIATLGLGPLGVNSFVGPALAGGSVRSRSSMTASRRLVRSSSACLSGRVPQELARASSAPTMSAAVEVNLPLETRLSVVRIAATNVQLHVVGSCVVR